MKGNAYENEIVKATGGKRVPLSGALAHVDKLLSEDVVLPLGERVQCKRERNSWITLYKLLETADALALRADGKISLMVLPLPMFQRYLAWALELKELKNDTKD